MKKLVFTIQMLTLIALFPIYLVVELNHETAGLPVKNSSLEFTGKPHESNIQPALNLKDKGLSFSILKTNTY